ncbi:MAG TPA: GntR family transcriptional regulator [Anaerolineae bacterium]|nr:GntR family transcriptional regulator [Anaerolineae bacterium]
MTLSTIKRNPSLVEQVKTHIKQHIMANTFAAGRIPSETELANELGVSRTTIRDALSRLELEGTIFRKQGAGTFVNEAGLQIKTRLEEMWDYEHVLAAHGYHHTTQIISVDNKPADIKIAADLALEIGDELVVVHKLFLADNQPVILVINYLPLHLIKLPFTNADFCPPIYQFLPQFCQQHLGYYLSEIVPLAASAELANILHVPPEKPLISFEEIGYNQDNAPILKAHSYFRDDLVRLRLIRRET